MAPAALSLIAITFTEPAERGKAFGVFGAIASSGAVTGLLLGGVLTEYAGWRWCLYVNVLVAAAALLVGSRVLPRGDGYPTSIDAISGVLATAGLASLVLACSQAATHGWGSARVIVPGAIGLALGAAFVARQARIDQPLLPLRILAHRSRATAYLAVATSVIGTFGMFLMLTYHFQVVLGVQPVAHRGRVPAAQPGRDRELRRRQPADGDAVRARTRWRPGSPSPRVGWRCSPGSSRPAGT